MENQITTNDRIQLETLRNTVARGTTDEEFRLFCEVVRASGLNPFRNEVWCIKAGGRLQIMTGINGYLRICNSHPQFDGMEKTFDWDEQGRLVSCTVSVHRKDRKFPATCTAFLRECAGNTPIWKQRPSVMLEKVAKSMAIREAFPQELVGTYTAEEMPDEFQRPVVHVTESAPREIEIDTSEIDDAPFIYDVEKREDLDRDEKKRLFFIAVKNGPAKRCAESGKWFSRERIAELEEHLISHPD